MALALKEGIEAIMTQNVSIVVLVGAEDNAL